MKKSFQLAAVLVAAMLGACSGGEEKKAETTADTVIEKPNVKLATVTSRDVEQVGEYTATVEAEAKNNIAPTTPVPTMVLKLLRPDGICSEFYTIFLFLSSIEFMVTYRAYLYSGSILQVFMELFCTNGVCLGCPIRFLCIRRIVDFPNILRFSTRQPQKQNNSKRCYHH